MKKLLLILFIFFSFSQISFANITEEEKVRWHLLRTENVLRKVDTTNLNENQVANRLKNLDILHKYALDGEFPNNDKFPGESRPFFRGSNGNLCAVGFLMYQDEGYRDYVDDIVQTNNLVEVMDIKEGKIFNWLDENGFTQLEAAMIQPTYGFIYFRMELYIPLIIILLIILIWFIAFIKTLIKLKREYLIDSGKIHKKKLKFITIIALVEILIVIALTKTVYIIHGIYCEIC